MDFSITLDLIVLTSAGEKFIQLRTVNFGKGEMGVKGFFSQPSELSDYRGRIAQSSLKPTSMTRISTFLCDGIKLFSVSFGAELVSCSLHSW